MRLRIWLFAAPVLLAGCSDPAARQPADNALDNAGAATDIDTFAAENMESAANISAPSGEPGPDDARSVVSGYFDALSARRYDRAYAMWEPNAVGMTAPAFAASFAKYRIYEADVGLPGRVDAGAGQRYVSVPVRITAVMADDGDEVTMIGPVTLHRTGAIDGASAAQRSWRIRATDFKPRPIATPANTPTARYSCGDLRFTASFDNQGDSATLELPGETPMTLAGQRPASGIWYAGGGWELRGKGNTATLTRPGAPTVNCTAD